MKLENERLYVEISELGAEVTRIRDKTNNAELLWEADPVYWKRHSPVLFPNVGKTYHNTVLINGTHYPTSQHGFARDSRFKCICEKADSASFLLASSEETKEVYPFDFELVITYTLKEKSLCVKWEVRNPGEEEMYFTIGGHPAFRFAGTDEKKEELYPEVPGQRFSAVYPYRSGRGCRRPHKSTYARSERGVLPGYGRNVRNDALIFDGGQIEEVWLCHKDGTPYVGMKL